jgi:hypothetical protein
LTALSIDEDVTYGDSGWFFQDVKNARFVPWMTIPTYQLSSVYMGGAKPHLL